uniref:Uncharacterized protein n=1 Tax=Pyxicephalus adspersus TaxID=30357 RepID=A0A499QJZ5_PYXAD|nr:hypothetical protein maker-66O13-exonerate_protein2genome-gene-0.13 [Pyxicephalus adspersus]
MDFFKVICYLLANVFNPEPDLFQVCWITQLHW